MLSGVEHACSLLLGASDGIRTRTPTQAWDATGYITDAGIPGGSRTRIHGFGDHGPTVGLPAYPGRAACKPIMQGLAARMARPFERRAGVGPASTAWEAVALTVVRTPRWHWAGRKEEKDLLVPRASDGIRTHSLPLRRRTHDPLCFQGCSAAFVHACGAGKALSSLGKGGWSPMRRVSC